jgi:hypothetical protein
VICKDGTICSSRQYNGNRPHAMKAPTVATKPRRVSSAGAVVGAGEEEDIESGAMKRRAVCAAPARLGKKAAAPT